VGLIITKKGLAVHAAIIGKIGIDDRNIFFSPGIRKGFYFIAAAMGDNEFNTVHLGLFS
jgi:hypothetical protein